MNILEFQEMKRKNHKISVLTCYDFGFAQILNESTIDALLVGDSSAMVMHGFPNTLNATLEMMELQTAAVVRGAPKKLVIADLPFMSYRKDLKTNIEAVERLMKAGGQAVKLEGSDGNLELVRHLVDSGVPVMGHLGLTPQSVHQLGGYKVQGREKTAQDRIRKQALDLQEAGCFSIVLECVPSTLAQTITRELEVPTIGIGAGTDVDGQVLVLHDLLGFQKEFKPKFVRRYFDAHTAFKNIFDQFNSDVKEHTFPKPEEAYS
jgi:3-methyl-2-oxobutanoate hydroxymethyltransferase